MDSNFTPFFRKNHGKHTAIVFAIICNCGSSKNFLSIDVFEYKKIGVSFPHACGNRLFKVDIPQAVEKFAVFNYPKK